MAYRSRVASKSIFACWCWMLVSTAISARAIPIGDQTGDGVVTVSDIQTLILLTLGGPLPVTLDGNANGVPDGCEDATAAGFVALFEAGWQATTSCQLPLVPDAPSWICSDLNVDGATNVSDIVLCIKMALDLPLSVAVDSNGDGHPKEWEAWQRSLVAQAYQAGQEAAKGYGSGCASQCSLGQSCCGGQCEGEVVESPCGSFPCDDGVDCTIDYCDPELGCSAWPDSRRCVAGGICDPGATAETTGCVSGDGPCAGLDVAEPVGVVCAVAPPYPGAVWTPPAVGDSVDCKLRLAAGDLACADSWLGCFLRHARFQIGWTKGWRLDALNLSLCTWDGCELSPIPYTTIDQSTWGFTPTGLEYGRIEAEFPEMWLSERTETVWIDFPYYSGGVGEALPHAYYGPDGVLAGNGDLVVARFMVTEPTSQAASLSMCLGDPIWKGNLSSPPFGTKPAPPKATVNKDGVVILSPGQGWVCDDEELCTVDSFVPGVGCLFDPLTEEDCDDGIWCTWDVCDTGTGECKHKGKSGSTQCPELGDLCILDSPFADPSTGCVHDMWSHICWSGGEFCTLADTIHWDGVSGPPEGDYLICPIRLVRSQEVCQNSQDAWCVPSYGAIRLGFDASLLEPVGGYDTVCYEGIGCFVLPWFDEAGTYALDTGQPYVGSNDLAFIGELGWQLVSFLSFTGKGVLSTAYLDQDGNVVGNATVVDIWFRFDDGLNQSLPTTICADSVNFGNRYLAHFADELAGDGLIILYPPE